MCGIAGILDRSIPKNMTKNLLRMGDSLAHRGPDADGIWINHEKYLGLSHRRLSIIDPSEAGSQPMHSINGRYVVVFNGEIYNHLKLRIELEKKIGPYNWIGHSDTETLLACFETWGVEDTLVRSIGMFSFALWDKNNSTLMLARDRFGEKPLYYGWVGDNFLFGSELKALKSHPSFHSNIDRNALCLFLRLNYIPAPYSIYEGVKKLMPGCLLSISLQHPEPKIKAFWSGIDASLNSKSEPFIESFDDAVTTLEVLLKDAVSQQMMSDVPLGAFLSGGVDSSTIVSMMQAQSIKPIKTFTIGFHDEILNEAKQAKSIAAYLGTEHNELYVSAEDAMSVIPRLSNLYDEPFADSSQIPTFLVSSLAQQQVKVSLSGDGGDELFAGYNRHQITQNTWRKISSIPIPIKKLSSRVITQISSEQWNHIFKIFEKAVPSIRGRWSNIGNLLHKGADVMLSKSDADLYNNLTSFWRDPSSIVLNGKEPQDLISNKVFDLDQLSATEKMMLQDMLSYLPDDILCKVDRASMAVSLESRSPFLDHRVFEFAWRLPIEFKLHRGESKRVLREVLYRHVPKKLIDSRKKGFGIPIDKWLRGPLREWAEDLLDESQLKIDGYFNPELIRLKWSEHLLGRRNWAGHLWSILMFQVWLRDQKSN